VVYVKLDNVDYKAIPMLETTKKLFEQLLTHFCRLACLFAVVV